MGNTMSLPCSIAYAITHSLTLSVRKNEKEMLYPVSLNEFYNFLLRISECSSILYLQSHSQITYQIPLSLPGFLFMSTH